MNNKSLITIFVFIAFSFFIILPFLIDPNPIKQDDLNGNIFQLVYLKQSLIENLKFPYWNPYVNQGLPFTSDPLNTYLYPIVFIFFIIFETNIAIKMTYITTILLACIGMYTLLRYLKIQRNISIITALTYASGGFLVSRIIAGHLEKILTYPLIPLFILFLFYLYKKPSVFSAGLVSLILTLMFFSGDIYTTLYSLIIILSLLIFNLFKIPKINIYFMCIFVFFFLFSSIKLLPLIEIQNLIAKDPDPFSGSMNFIGLIYYIFIPIKPFFEYLNLNNYIPTAFGWWEKIAFIGFIPLLTFIIFIIKYKKIKISHKYIIPISIITLLVISTPAVNINPYHILIDNIPKLAYFHVPSRTFAYITALLLVIMAIIASYFYKKRIDKIIIIFLITTNLVFTIIFFYSAYHTRQFKPVNSGYTKLFEILSEDSDIYYVSSRRFSLPQQSDFVQYKIKNLNSNYGFQLINSPASKFTKFDYQNIDYKDIKPKYIFAENELHIPKSFVSSLVWSENGISLYKIDNHTDYVQISGGLITDINIITNKITVNTISSKSGTLILHESNFPGWEVYKNGEKINLMQNRFLSIYTTTGTNNYEFKFTPRMFYLGFSISIISLAIWTYIVIYHNKFHRKKYLHKFLKYF